MSISNKVTPQMEMQSQAVSNYGQAAFITCPAGTSVVPRKENAQGQGSMPPISGLVISCETNAASSVPKGEIPKDAASPMIVAVGGGRIAYACDARTSSATFGSVLTQADGSEVYGAYCVPRK